MDDLISRLTDRRKNKRQIQNKSPVSYTSDRGGLTLYSGQSTMNAQRAYDAYGSVGTLFSIVRQLYTAFSKVPWHLYRKTSSSRDNARRPEVSNHEIIDRWNNPNPFMTGKIFRETCQQHLDLVGETIIVLSKIGPFILEWWPVRPDWIKPVKHPTDFMTGWIFCGPDGQEVPLTLDQVIQIKYPNPSDPYRGMGPVQTVLNDIDSSMYSAEWNKNFFINGAAPGGVIEVDYTMNDDEFNRFVNRWRQQHQGVANAHRVAVVENAKWVSVPFSMEDMQFTELRNLPRELIREAFAFPKPMLGTVDDVNRANSDAAKEIMAEMHTVPRLDSWKDILNNRLVPQYQNGQNLEMDYDNPVPLNPEAENAKRNSQATAASTLVTAGWEPNDVLETVGLPAMRFRGQSPEGESE